MHKIKFNTGSSQGIFIICIIVVIVGSLATVFFLSGDENTESEKYNDKTASQMKCVKTKVIQSKSGPETITHSTYFEGDKFKEEVTPGRRQVRLYDGSNVVYSWLGGDKEGTLDRLSCGDEILAVMSKARREEQKKRWENIPGSSLNTNTEMHRQWKKNVLDEIKALPLNPEYTCTLTSGVDFSPPTTMSFHDNCEPLIEWNKIRDTKVDVR